MKSFFISFNLVSLKCDSQQILAGNFLFQFKDGHSLGGLYHKLKMYFYSLTLFHAPSHLRSITSSEVMYQPQQA